MILADLAAIKTRCERAGQPKVFCGDCGLRIATQEDHDTTKEGEGADLCWGDFGDCGVVFGITADWRGHYASDVPALLEAVERLLSMLTDAQTEAEMQAAEVERLRGAEGIVRKLATADWVYDTYICFHCKALVADEEPEVMDEPHATDCLHALALAYVEANPA